MICQRQPFLLPPVSTAVVDIYFSFRVGQETAPPFLFLTDFSQIHRKKLENKGKFTSLVMKGSQVQVPFEADCKNSEKPYKIKVLRYFFMLFI